MRFYIYEILIIIFIIHITSSMYSCVNKTILSISTVSDLCELYRAIVMRFAKFNKRNK